MSKRAIVLASATRVLAEKGFEGATISEIAKEAQIAPSGIYTCFNSKEEILFAIIEEFLIESIEGIKDHLEGILGAINKLRKAVWCHCKFYSASRKEIQIILESRSYPEFYKSSAYKKLKQYSGIFTTIIEQGVAEGSFRKSIPPRIVRDMILGTVDHVAINWTLKNGTSPLEVAEHLFDLISNAITRKKTIISPANKKERKRRQIICCASKLFASYGYKDTNVMEIARQAGVSEGTIYDYYQNKENLLINIPEEKLGQLLDELSGNSPEIELRKLIYSLFNFYNEDHDYSRILVLMLRPNKKFYYSESNKILEKIFSIIQGIIRDGQNSGVFISELRPTVCRALLFGSIDHILIPWIIFKRNYDLIKVRNEIASLFIDALKENS
ncbi:MAG: TetR/AcrR family transcriptional regulator [Desulfobacteraceae bacterium]|nr:TetR/AcrR family transcriptional regulator [Desulfobacteraceae bacterium]